MREDYNVDGLIIEDGTVVGIRNGDREDRARIVIGADGRNSHVARRSRPRSTTPSRGCSTPTTPTSADLPIDRMEILHPARTEASRLRRPTTG